jgi:hypothetical protein
MELRDVEIDCLVIVSLNQGSRASNVQFLPSPLGEGTPPIRTTTLDSTPSHRPLIEKAGGKLPPISTSEEPTTATPEKRRSTHRARIDKHQAAQAIYIDFESIPHQEPTVLGFAWNDIWTAVILDRELADAANWKVPGGNAVALTPNEALTIVRSIAMWKKRKVCAWSEHELRTIQPIYAKQPNKRK